MGWSRAAERDFFRLFLSAFFSFFLSCCIIPVLLRRHEPCITIIVFCATIASNTFVLVVAFFFDFRELRLLIFDIAICRLHREPPELRLYNLTLIYLIYDITFENFHDRCKPQCLDKEFLYRTGYIA